MSKIVLNDTSGGYNIQTINDNFQKIEDELNNKVFYRNNPAGEPNSLSTDLDANGKRVFNLPQPVSPSEAARLQDVTNAIAGGAANLIPFTPTGDISSTNVQSAIVEVNTFLQSGTGAVNRFVTDKLKEIVSVKDFGAVGDGVTNDTVAIQSALNASRGPCFVPPGIYLVTSELIIPDGSGLIGVSAFWKRRTGYVYNGNKHSVIKYIGAAGLNTCVIRASATAVGVQATDFTPPDTDDLLCITLRDLHVDANGLADYGFYVYRAGNQSTLENLTAEKTVKANHVHLGCYAAKFGTFGAYESQNEGIVCGWDIFGWNTVEATNFSYSAHFLTANNGTAGTYVAGTGTDLEGSGGRFSVGRGSVVRITSESNDGRACILSQYNLANASGGSTEYIVEYLEGNADGPYIDYRDGMDGLKLKNGFLHPGNGSTLLPQNIKIEGKNNSGVVTADSGPADSNEWLVIEGLFGDLSGTGPAINSNTFKYTIRDSARKFVLTGSFPGRDDYIPTSQQVGASVYFTATASPSIFNAVNGTLARTGVGTFVFTFIRPFRTAGAHTPMLSILLSASLDTKTRMTSISQSSVTIRTYDAAGVLADTGDRIGFMMAGTLAYQP